MKKVALISDGWKRMFMYAWVDGIMNKIAEYSEEICLYQYNCHGNWSKDDFHNQGEYNIFNLPDLKEFDGIVLDCNNIVDKSVLEYVIELIRKSGVPAVSIARDIDGFYYVGIDNEKPIYEMMEHMYKVHNCRRFVFAGGPRDNYENERRVGAYRFFLEKYGMNEDDNPIFYGDYDFENGVNFFKNYIESERTLPDAVICACDNISVGVCTQAEKMGYKIPQDFRVTGFDNLDKASYFKPQIATVDHHNRGFISGKCMEILFDIWEGKTPRKYNFTDATCIFGESCGCENSGVIDYREHMKNQILYGIEQAKEDELASELEGNMSKCTEFFEMYQCMNNFLKGYDCDGFFVVVDDALTNADAREKFSTVGYNEENMKVVYAFDKDMDDDLEFSEVKQLYKYIEKIGGRNQYLFNPIHFKHHTVGYSIVKNPRFLYDRPYFYDLHNILVKELESFYDHTKLAIANKKLNDIYNKDQLTGIYNRVAYAEIITPEFKEYHERGVVCAIGFIDVDKFKQINDTYGHEYGDEVLKKVANILKQNCPREGYACRYGGDEFIIFFPYADEKKAEDVKMAINKAADKMNVKLSIGIVLSGDSYGSDINEYFEVADKYMYEEKLKHKAERK